MAIAFGIEIDKDVVRRILSGHYRPGRVRKVLPGLAFSATPKTVCGAAICSDANPQP
jgi:hypothetical protein